MLNKNLTKIMYSGASVDIDAACLLSEEILAHMMGVEYECTLEQIAQLRRDEPKLYKRLLQDDICCVVDMISADTAYTIYAASIKEINQCKVIIDGETLSN